MATFKACVQKERKDGFYPVYIRVTHHRGTQFMKTDKMVTKKELSRAKEIEDPYVLQYCAGRIVEYNERLNKKDIEHWTVKEVVDFLTNGNDDICFSDYARVHIDRMIDRGQECQELQACPTTSGTVHRNQPSDVRSVDLYAGEQMDKVA